MAEKLFEEFGQAFEVLLIPDKGGKFEVDVDGTPIFSKLETGRHAEYEELAGPIRALVKG
jgi:selT/selW/selH-like putative selenoprotein